MPMLPKVPIGPILEIAKAVLDVAEQAAEVPKDWNDEKAVAGWIDGTEAPMAHLIVLLVPDNKPMAVKRPGNRIQSCAATYMLAARLEHAPPRGPADIDLDWLIDLLVEMLVKMFPDQEDLIRMIGELVKQMLDLFMDELDKSDALKQYCLQHTA